MTTAKDGAVTVAAKASWRTRQFWLVMGLIMATCVLIGYLIGNWVAATGAKTILAQQEAAYQDAAYQDAAYQDASDARKAVLQQCLTSMEEQNRRLAALGDKAVNATAAAADAIKQVAGEKTAN